MNTLQLSKLGRDLLIVLLLAFSAFGLNGQQELRFNTENLFTSNPAFLMRDHIVNVNALYQYEFTNLDKSPLSYMASGQLYAEDFGFAAGLALQNKDYRLLSQKEIDLSSSYTTRLSKSKSLSVGLALKMNFLSIDQSKILAENILDPLLAATGRETAQNSHVGIGLAFSHGHFDSGHDNNFRWTIGAGYYKNVSSRYYFSSLSFRDQSYWTGVASAYIPAGRNFTLRPTIETHIYPEQDLYYNFILQADLGDVILAGISLDKSLTLGLEVGTTFGGISPLRRENIWRITANAGIPVGEVNQFGMGLGITLAYMLNDSYR